MSDHSEQFRQDRSKQRRFALRASRFDALRSLEGGRSSAGSAPSVESGTRENGDRREEEPSPDGAAVTLSDEDLKSVAGGTGRSDKDPGKLREARHCYLADAAPEREVPTMPDGSLLVFGVFR